MEREAKQKKKRQGNGRSAMIGGVALGLVALLILIAPLANAALVIPPRTAGGTGLVAAGPLYVRAPYSNALTVQSAALQMSGAGAQVQLIVPGSFDSNRGVAQEYVNSIVMVSSPVQGPPVVASYVTTLGISDLKFTTGPAGMHKMTVGWTVGFAALLRAVPTGPGGPQGLISQIQVQATAYLVEPQTGATVAGSIATVPIWNDMVRMGQVQVYQPSHAYLFGPSLIALAASHTYALYTALHISVVSMAYPGASGGATITTSFNLDISPSTLLFVSVT